MHTHTVLCLALAALSTTVAGLPLSLFKREENAVMFSIHLPSSAARSEYTKAREGADAKDVLGVPIVTSES